MTQTIKKMSLPGLILMIFTSVFGFANSPSAFYLMGYSAIPWYIFSALLFFIPFALMMAEMGSAYRKEEGGIYSWMNNSVGPRYAFIGTFMWFSSYVIWMVSTAAKVWVPFSTFLFAARRCRRTAERHPRRSLCAARDAPTGVATGSNFVSRVGRRGSLRAPWHASAVARLVDRRPAQAARHDTRTRQRRWR